MTENIENTEKQEDKEEKIEIKSETKTEVSSFVNEPKMSQGEDFKQKRSKKGYFFNNLEQLHTF